MPPIKIDNFQSSKKKGALLIPTKAMEETKNKGWSKYFISKDTLLLTPTYHDTRIGNNAKLSTLPHWNCPSYMRIKRGDKSQNPHLFFGRKCKQL